MTDSISNQKVKEGLLFRDICLFREVLNPHPADSALQKILSAAETGTNERETRHSEAERWVHWPLRVGNGFLLGCVFRSLKQKGEILYLSENKKKSMREKYCQKEQSMNWRKCLKSKRQGAYVPHRAADFKNSSRCQEGQCLQTRMKREMPMEL